MVFGESYPRDEYDFLKAALKKSFNYLGEAILYLSSAGGDAQIIKDKLGGVKKIISLVSPCKKRIKASINFSPSPEIRNIVGVKGDYTVLISVDASDFDKPLNTELDKFIIRGQEYRITDFKLDALFEEETAVFQIGLKSK